jgi:DNA recombination protein RmuC
MALDFPILLVFGLLVGSCAALLVYVLNLKAAFRTQQALTLSDNALLESLRTERDLAIQNGIRLEAELTSERRQAVARIDSLNEAKEALTAQFKNLANEILEDKSKRFT